MFTFQLRSHEISSAHCMNYLAHIVLSPLHVEYQIGNVLADPLKGQAWQGSSKRHRAGMQMHSAIDIFTDQHPLVHKSKSRLAARGHLRGVVIDVLYDHFLSKHWSQFMSEDFDGFIDRFHDQAHVHGKQLPLDAQRFVLRMVDSNLLRSYQRVEQLTHCFQRIDTRLSQRTLKRESTSGHYAAIEQHYDALEQDFLGFYPELAAHMQAA